jgi:hypothetical protein
MAATRVEGVRGAAVRGAVDREEEERAAGRAAAAARRTRAGDSIFLSVFVGAQEKKTQSGVGG